MSKKTKRSISTFAILLAVLLLVSIATWIAAGKTYTGEDGEIAEVVGASASDIFMGPVNGWADAADVILIPCRNLSVIEFPYNPMESLCAF